MKPSCLLCVVPSRLRVGEGFAAKVKVRGTVRSIACGGGWNARKPGLSGPFNLNVARQIQYMDDCLPEWTGMLSIDSPALDGPKSLEFDGRSQGVFPKDTRPIKTLAGLRWTEPGFHFPELRDPVSGMHAWSNPCYVSE